MAPARFVGGGNYHLLRRDGELVGFGGQFGLGQPDFSVVILLQRQRRQFVEVGQQLRYIAGGR